jgi:hypothetical protein
VLPDGVPEAYLPMLERVARSCPAHNTLTQPPEIGIELIAGAALATGR